MSAKELIPPTYPCTRTQSDVYFEDLRDIINDKVFVICHYYDSGSFGVNPFPCIKNAPMKCKCLVELRVKTESNKVRLVR